MAESPVQPSRPTWRAWLLRAAVLAVLLAVGASYLSTEMVVDLSNRFWACF